MGANAGIVILIAGFVFVDFMVLALVGVFKDERIGLVKDKPGRKKRGSTGPAQRRGSRSRKRDKENTCPRAPRSPSPPNARQQTSTRYSRPSTSRLPG